MSTHYFRFSVRGSTGRRRSDLLERLLARSEERTSALGWRAEAFDLIAPEAQVAPSAAVALCAARGEVAGAWVFFATPVHYVAEMSNVRLAADGILSLNPADAETLAVDFNRLWHDAGIRLMTGHAGQLFVIVDQALPAATCDPEDVLDRHIENYLPSGAGAARLRRLMSEIEMWLFDHAVNRTRIACGSVQVSGLWLWGAGAVFKSLPPVQGWTAGNDPFFASLQRGSSVADQPGAGDAGNATSGVRGAGNATSGVGGANSGVIVIADEPGTDAWQEAESRWLAPAFEQLRSGRLSRIDLSAGDRRYRVKAGWNWRFLRRRRPWWEFFA